MQDNNKNADKFSLLIVDDHAMFIDGLQTILERNIKNISKIHTAIDAYQALNCLEKNKIDLVITDINMPGMSGIELTRIIKEKYNETKVLVLTMDDSKSTISEIINVEAEGYILKNSDKKELINAIKRIIDKATYYSSSILQIISNIVRETYKHNQPRITELENLSEREIDVIKLICDELTSEEIAEKLFIAKATVDVHRKNVLRKLQVKNSVGIYKYALQAGIIVT